MSNALFVDVDLLQMDCNGCEWALFTHLQRHAPAALRQVRLLNLRINVCMLPRVKGRASLLGLQAMLNHLFVDHGFRQYFSAALQQGTQPQEANTASQGVPPPALVEAGAAAGVCRYQLQFSRNTVRNLHRAK